MSEAPRRNVVGIVVALFSLAVAAWLFYLALSWDDASYWWLILIGLFPGQLGIVGLFQSIPKIRRDVNGRPIE